MYKYEIVRDMGYDGVDVETIYSNKKFSDEEFEKIVRDTMKVSSDIKDVILENHPDFFDLEKGASVTLEW